FWIRLFERIAALRVTRGRSPTDANKKADSKAPKDHSLNVKIKSQQFLKTNKSIDNPITLSES
ncbi:MAG: hypothetical protein AB8G77_17670, partial [Rhodothermales bacterium]